MVNPVYSAPDIAKIRSRYRARDTVYFDPCAVVWRAKVASVPVAADGTYLQISYNTVSTGAYTDIREGQMVIISETTDHMSPVEGYRDMRVSKTPTSSILYINESALPLDTDYYITVINTYRPLQKVRQGALVDGYLTYQKLAPMIKGLPSVQFVESATTGQFSFPDVVGVSLTGGTITYLWEIPGAVYDTGTSTSQNPVVTALHGHTWGRLTITDSNGPTNFMVFQLIVQDPNNPTLASMNIDQLRLNRTWQGHHASCRAEAGVSIETLMNGTRAVIVSRRTYAGGTLAGAMSNIAFVGYLSKEANSTQSIDDKSVTFDLVGIWERAGQLPFNPIAIRDVASPNRWDEIPLPTPPNVSAHVFARYSNIPNLDSLDLGVIDSTWYGGDMDVNATSLGDAIKQVLSEINAEIIQNPSGELFLRRDLRYETDEVRDAADVVWTLINADLRSLDVQIRHDEQTGRIIIGFRGYQTSRVPSKGGKAVAPAVTLGTSSETRTRNNQLMHADLSDADLLAEAEERAGNILAVENPPFEMSAAVMPYLSWLTPSCSQWIQLDLTASIITRGRAFNQRCLLESMEYSYDNIIGSHDLSISLLPETRGGAALVVAAITPNVSGLSMFVLPPFPAYGGSYGGPSTLNSTDDDGPAFNQNDMGGMGNPLPGDQAQEEGNYAPEPGKKKFAISFANESNVGAGFTSVLSDPYTITASGSARIAVGDPIEISALVDLPGNDTGIDVQEGDEIDIEAEGEWCYGVFTPEECNDADGDPTNDGGNQPEPHTGAPLENDYLGLLVARVGTDGPWTPIGVSGSFTAPTGGRLYLIINDKTGFYGDNEGSLIVTIGTPGNATYGDAFYQWELNEEGEETNLSLLGALAGLFIDNATAASPPPYSPSHSYTFDWTGTGNIPELRFEDPASIWTDNDNKPIHITIEGSGVDS